MFSPADKDELIRRRPDTDRVDLGSGGHDAHLDAFEAWVGTLRNWLLGNAIRRDVGPCPNVVEFRFNV